jgi:hypothetical protein
MTNLVLGDLYHSSRIDLDFDPNDCGTDDDDVDDEGVDAKPSRLMPMDEDDDEDGIFGSSASDIVLNHGERSRDGGGRRHDGRAMTNDGVAANGRVEFRGADASTSADDVAVASREVRKLVKVRLSNAGREGPTMPSMVATVAVDVSMEQRLGNGAYHHSSFLGVGQNVTFRHETRNERERTGGGTNAIVMAWDPPTRSNEEAWRPPLVLSSNDLDGMDVDRARNRYGRSDRERSSRTNSNSIEVVESNVWTPPESAGSIPAAIGGEVASNAVPSISNMASERSSSQSRGNSRPFVIPTILSCKVRKHAHADKYGLAVRKSSNGSIVIEKITPESPFAGTAMRPGYECLSINRHRLHSARRAAEIIRECKTSLTLVASDVPRPPETNYAVISMRKYSSSMKHSASMNDLRDVASSRMNRCSSMTDLRSPGSKEGCAAGMYFKMRNGLVKMVRADSDSPIESTSMKAGDFVLAINGSAVESISKAVDLLSDSRDDMVPILYLSMRQLRVSLVDRVIGDLWNKEWSDECDECIVLQRNGLAGGSSNGSLNPMTIRFKEDGRCELLDPLRSFREKSKENDMVVVPSDHPLNSVVETLNDEITSFLLAIREGVALASNRRLSTKEL